MRNGLGPSFFAPLVHIQQRESSDYVNDVVLRALNMNGQSETTLMNSTVESEQSET